MRVRCPHCQNPLNVVDTGSMDEASCPSCGSRFPLVDMTLSYREPTLEHVAHFELLNKVGAGQFGSVYRARDTRLNRIVAIKIPRADETDERHRALFLREARAAAGLDHPNIVHVYEVGEDSEHVFIASQFVDGITLRDKLQSGCLPSVAAAEFLALICDAVHHAHECGVIHRDLKPSNILIDADGTPHVTDFGLAKLESAEVTLTVSGLILGTPAYMSPEQASGSSHEVDRSSDVYSLGVILYEVLTGKRPFEGTSKLLLHQIQSQDPRAPRTLNREIPRDLETICMKAMGKSPATRYATAKAMADDLRRFAAGQPIVARRTSPIEHSWRWIRRNPVVSSTVAMSLVSTTAAIALGFAKPADIRSGVRPGDEVRIIQALPVQQATEPPGATLVFYPLDEVSGEPIAHKAIHPRTKSPASLNLLPGDYLVVAALDDGRFHEVYRHVPKSRDAIAEMFPHRRWQNVNGVLQLWRIAVPSADVAQPMALFDGSPTFLAGELDDGTDAERTRRVRAFYLDPHETTVEEIIQRCELLPAALRGKTKDQLPPDDHPLDRVLWDEAVMIAEQLGKRLPTEWEYEFAATNGGTTRYPWGNDAPPADAGAPHQRAGQPDFDRTSTTPPVLGLFSNVPEYVDSHCAPLPKFAAANEFASETPGQFIGLRGRAPGSSVVTPHVEYSPRRRICDARRGIVDGVGFRCAKSKSPRLNAEDF